MTVVIQKKKIMEIKKVYIIQSYSGTIPSKIIKIFTNYEYSHIMISTDNSFDKMYSFGRRKVNNFLNSGFVIESKDGEFFQNFKDTRCRVYELSVSIEEYKNIINLLDSYEKNKELYNYDIIGIILRFFGFRIKRENHYVCSQFAAEILEKCNIYSFPKPNEFVKPSDFDNIPNKDLFYCGNINDL